MKFLMFVCSLTLVLGVASNLSFAKTKAAAKSKAEKSEAKKPEYDGDCAMGVCNDHFVKGDPKIKLERDGKVYYFADEESKKEFEKDYDANVKKANERWKAFISHGGTHAQ